MILFHFAPTATLFCGNSWMWSVSFHATQFKFYTSEPCIYNVFILLSQVLPKIVFFFLIGANRSLHKWPAESKCGMWGLMNRVCSFLMFFILLFIRSTNFNRVWFFFLTGLHFKKSNLFVHPLYFQGLGRGWRTHHHESWSIPQTWSYRRESRQRWTVRPRVGQPPWWSGIKMERGWKQTARIPARTACCSLQVRSSFSGLCMDAGASQTKGSMCV